MKEIEEILESKGICFIVMCILIYKYMVEKEIVLVFIDIENVFIKFDRIILYRILKIFEENGIVY